MIESHVFRTVPSGLALKASGSGEPISGRLIAQAWVFGFLNAFVEECDDRSEDKDEGHEHESSRELLIVGGVSHAHGEGAASIGGWNGSDPSRQIKIFRAHSRSDSFSDSDSSA